MTPFGRLPARIGLAMALLVPFGTGAVAEEASASETRVSRSLYFARDGRDQQVADKESLDEVATGAATAKQGRRSAAQKSQSVRSESPNTEFWFYTADVELYGDRDLDGYFHGIDLLFDADTIYEHADVYAVLYLSRDGGPWYEYAETDVFSLYGATSDDDFVVVSDLLAGYPAGSYDILIELYDTWDGAFVADLGPESNPDLGYLPLEDVERDEPYEPPDVVVVEEGGGAAGPTFLLFLTLLLIAAAFSRQRSLREPVRLPDHREPRA